MGSLSSDHIDTFKAAYASSDIENGLHALRIASVSQVESVRVLMHVLALSLKEADDIVIHSATWADMYDRTTELRDAFTESLSNTATENQENDNSSNCPQAGNSI